MKFYEGPPELRLLHYMLDAAEVSGLQLDIKTLAEHDMLAANRLEQLWGERQPQRQVHLLTRAYASYPIDLEPLIDFLSTGAVDPWSGGCGTTIFALDTVAHWLSVHEHGLEQEVVDWVNAHRLAFIEVPCERFPDGS